MTTGVAFWAGELSLSDGTVLQRVQEQQRQWEEKQSAAEARKKEELAKLKAKVDRTRAKSPAPVNWNLNDLCAMVSWFKRPGDSKVPQRKEDLIRRYLLTCTRSEQERNRLKEGEQPVVDEEGVDGGDGEGAEEWASSPLHIFCA